MTIITDLRVGDKILLFIEGRINPYPKTILAIGKRIVEWDGGYSLKCYLKENTNKKSKEKYCIKIAK